MRNRVPWMNGTDDAILEFLEALGTPGGEPVIVPPHDLWLNINKLRGATTKAPNTISRRMDRLESMGLLERFDDGAHYAITDKGRASLAGELDASELEQPA
jgi:DNA-binding IclR family transcriptional regulator